MSEVFWNRMTAAELNAQAANDAIVLLPVASTEQHGPHLTTGVDVFLGTEGCRRVAERVAKVRPIVVAPTVWMGLADHHVAYGGSFTISLSTYQSLLTDLCRSILGAGFKKILLVNSHGGNVAAMNAFTSELRRALDAPIATTTLYNLAHEANAYAPVLDDQTGVRHACEAETSMMMATASDCIRSERLVDAYGPYGSGSVGQMPAFGLWKSFRDLTPSGVMGDARKATVEKGEKLFDIAAELLANKLIAGEPWN